MDIPEPLEDHVLSVDINVPRTRVWEAITETGAIQRFMMNTVLESTLEPGARMLYYSPNRKYVFVVGEVLEVIPERRFRHTYMFTTQGEAPSIVTWEFEDIAEGCRVTLTHSGWTTQVKTHKDVGGGWRMILDALKSELETGTIPFKLRMMYTVMGKLAFLLPKTARAETYK